MIVPIKTNDIVTNDGNRYLVKSVQLTTGGGIVEVSPIVDKAEIFHIEELSLEDTQEKNRRIKSAGINFEEDSKLAIPSGMSIAEANRILRMAQTSRKNK